MRFLFLITFAARTPDEIGNSTGQVWQTCAGVYQGSLLLSTPGQPHMPGSQAVRRCLIVYPDRVNADGHAKDRPRRWHSRSVGVPAARFNRATGDGTKIYGMRRVL